MEEDGKASGIFSRFNKEGVLGFRSSLNSMIFIPPPSSISRILGLCGSELANLVPA